ncbi:MAG: exonuclease domain-containing protein, partial [Candidatus Nanopelagicales bacterium]
AVNNLAAAHHGAEERLREQLAASEDEARVERDALLAVLAGLDVPVGLVDEHGRIMLVNPSARAALGRERHLAAGRSIFSVFDAGDFAPLLAQALAGRRVTARVDEFEVRLLRITGEGADPAVLLIGSAGDHDPGLPEDARLPEVGLSRDLRRRTSPHAAPEAWRGTPLTELIFTVVDCETTGLHVDAGDRLVSVGAVRVVDGQLRPEDTFDELTNPGRPIPASSTAFHGIVDDMVAEAPPPPAVAAAFAGFAADSVLVGHHLPFDLGFLVPAARAAGAQLGDQTLDTLLLSAVLFDDDGARHSLDALCERLGVSILGRHSALGDALGTAEALVRMIPLLATRGIHTLGQAQDACAGTAQARRTRSRAV